MKTDKTFPSRLELRESALDKWLSGQELRVLDLGAGEGLLWSTLRKNLTVSKYTAVDKNPQMPLTLGSRVDLGFLTNIQLKQYNVIDIECDSDTLEIWLSVSMFIQTPTLVIFTVVRPKKEWLDKKSKAILGLPTSMANVPANEKLWEHVEITAIRRGIAYAHADESYLAFNHKNKTFGAAFWCPGKKSI